MKMKGLWFDRGVLRACECADVREVADERESEIDHSTSDLTEHGGELVAKSDIPRIHLYQKCHNIMMPHLVIHSVLDPCSLHDLS